MFWVCHVILSREINVWSCSSISFIQLLLTNPTLSQNWKNSSLGHNLIQPSWIAHYAVSFLKHQRFLLALHNAQSLPPTTMQFTNLVVKPSPYVLKLCNISIQLSQHCKFCSLNPQASVLHSQTTQLCNHLSYCHSSTAHFQF